MRSGRSLFIRLFLTLALVLAVELAAPRARAVAAAGDPDAGFGVGGAVSFPIAATQGGETGMVVRPDGKIVAAALVDSALRILQLDSVGAPDTSFGEDGDAGGVLLPTPQTSLRGVALALQDDGKVVVALARLDTSEGNRFRLARFDRDGRLDPFFANAGAVRDSPVDGDVMRSVADVAVQPDSRILLAFTRSGGIDVPTSTERLVAGLARYDGNGALDATFGAGGIVASDQGYLTDVPEALAVQPDGRIVVVGRRTTGPGSASVVVSRYDAQGALDPAFGVAGTTTIAGGSAFALALQADGKILLGGSLGGAIVWRLDATGALDVGFGAGGGVALAGLQGPVHALATQADGKAVVAGTFAGDLAVTRLTGSGAPDVAFGSSGTVVTPLPGGHAAAREIAAAIQADGKALATAYGEQALVVARYQGDAPSTCGNGVLEPAERCDDGGVAGGDGCDAGCSGEPCFVCAGAGAGSCTPNPLDSDADGLCDGLDNCPLAANVAQDDGDDDTRGDACDSCPASTDSTLVDADGDGAGDVCDACTLPSGLSRASLRITGVNGAGATDGLQLRGRTNLGSPFVPGFDPVTDGVRFQVHDALGATVLDVTVPGGAYDGPTRTGWKSPRAGRWTYQRPADGSLPVVRAALARNAKHPGVLDFSISGKNADLLSAAPPLPLRVTLTLEPPIATADACAELTFGEQGCVVSASGKLGCKCKVDSGGVCR